MLEKKPHLFKFSTLFRKFLCKIVEPIKQSFVFKVLGV